MLKRLVALLVLAAVVLGAAAIVLHQRWQQPLNISKGGYILTVAPGEAFSGVAAHLQADGVLVDPWMLRIYARATGLDQQIRHGEYRVPAGTTPEALLVLLRSGRVISYQVTLPEGITLRRAVEILAGQKRLTHLLSGPDDPRLLALVAPLQTAEGWFFPDSYRYERGATDLEILERAHTAMQAVLDEEWSQRDADLPYEQPYQALIMASIIERETGMPTERGEIAGVFVRRLQKHMKLQTDPTVIYGLGASFDGNLRRSHLQDGSNPYNTYRHQGLPPSPIALPGRAAIHAALHPEPGNTLFFVARGDGGHEFSASLAEHQRAVRKYQLKRREDYRSSPAQQADSQ